MPEGITTSAPTISAVVILSDESSDAYYLIPEEDRVFVLEESRYYLLDEEDRVWHI